MDKVSHSSIAPPFAGSFTPGTTSTLAVPSLPPESDDFSSITIVNTSSGTDTISVNDSTGGPAVSGSGIVLKPGQVYHVDPSGGFPMPRRGITVVGSGAGDTCSVAYY